MEKRVLKILWVLVNYNADNEIYEFINNIKSVINSSKIEFYVVDNSSSLLPRSEDDNINIINVDYNLGYLKAFNFAVECYLKKNNNDYPEFTVLSNTDMKLDNNFKCFFDIQCAEKFDVFSPQIITADGYDSNPFIRKRFSKRNLYFNVFCSYYFSYIVKSFVKLLVNNLFNNKSYKKDQYFNLNDNNYECYGIHGSFMSFSKKFFLSGCNLSNYKSFLYCEELFVSEEARLHTLKVGFTDKIKIIHEENKYTSTITTANNLKWYRDSLTNFINKYYR